MRGKNTKDKTSCRKSKWDVSFAQLRKRFVIVVVVVIGDGAGGGGGGDCAGAAVPLHSIV